MQVTSYSSNNPPKMINNQMQFKNHPVDHKKIDLEMGKVKDKEKTKKTEDERKRERKRDKQCCDNMKDCIDFGNDCCDFWKKCKGDDDKNGSIPDLYSNPVQSHNTFDHCGVELLIIVAIFSGIAILYFVYQGLKALYEECKRN